MHPEFFEFLVCPLTKGPLRYDSSNDEFVSEGARLAYPIRCGIPILVPEEARPLELHSGLFTRHASAENPCKREEDSGEAVDGEEKTT